MLDINAKNYISMASVVLKAKSEVPVNRLWEMLHDNYGIGIRGIGVFCLTPGHRVQLLELVKKEMGLNLKTDKYQDLKSLSQTELSAKSNRAKSLSAKPRAPFIELRYCDGKTIERGYRGLKVSHILTLKIDVVLSVENFDTFVSLSAEQLANFGFKITEKVLIVFRGDSRASPKAVQLFRQTYKGRWAHFGDFDPKGLHIGAVELNAQTLLLPTLDFLNHSKPTFNQTDLYNKQRAFIDIIPIQNKQMRELITIMKADELALEQEHLIARAVPLTLVNVT
tara:strand:- start:135777 stop:136619 length:843 start_codon:yes stop_codon:yes gene_type:complete